MDEWTKKWQLPLSADKTLHLRLGASSTFTPYAIGNSIISKVESVRDLGFHYDATLDFSKHYDIICRKALVRTFRIFKALATVDQQVLLRIYKMYVRPIIEWGSVIINPYRKRDIFKLEKVQNNFTRKLFLRTSGLPYNKIPNASNRNKCLSLDSLEARRKVFDVLMVKKILSGKVSIKTTDFSC